MLSACAGMRLIQVTGGSLSQWKCHLEHLFNRMIKYAENRLERIIMDGRTFSLFLEKMAQDLYHFVAMEKMNKQGVLLESVSQPFKQVKWQEESGLKVEIRFSGGKHV